MEREQKSAIIHDLSKKMVFLTGPRQAGKTTLAKSIASTFSSSIYLNYDHFKDRNIILKEGWLPSTELIILDEILKGTNSKDKEEGSKRFVQKLVASKSTGIIATHDLGLCAISEELPQVKNKYFDAEIVNDELFFDYRYKEGICQNMNASFLLNKMGIV